jgi:hypothetical protein
VRERWRAGGLHGVTVYRDDTVVGVMQTRELAEEVAETMDLRQLQRTRVERAIAHWRLENPLGLPNPELTYPDLGELVTWLLGKAGLL